MGTIDTTQGGYIQVCGLDRLRYFPRQLLTADDMRLEQDYFREKQRRHNRFLHGWGVVSGLVVGPGPAPLSLTISPGYALGPCGDEIYVPEPVTPDLTQAAQEMLAQLVSAHPERAASESFVVLCIVIRYAECRTRPVRTLPVGCGCDDCECELSRISDGFEIGCVPPREYYEIPEETLCTIQREISNDRLPSLSPPPHDEWIALAWMMLDLNLKGDPVQFRANSIDNRKRRVLYSATQIQEEVIRSCCAGT